MCVGAVSLFDPLSVIMLCVVAFVLVRILRDVHATMRAKQEGN